MIVISHHNMADGWQFICLYSFWGSSSGNIWIKEDQWKIAMLIQSLLFLEMLLHLKFYFYFYLLSAPSNYLLQTRAFGFLDGKGLEEVCGSVCWRAQPDDSLSVHSMVSECFNPSGAPAQKKRFLAKYWAMCLVT